MLNLISEKSVVMEIVYKVTNTCIFFRFVSVENDHISFCFAFSDGELVDGR